MLKLPVHRPPFVLCMLAKNINTQVYQNCWFTSIIIFVHRFRTAFFIHKWTTLAQTIQMYITTSQRSVQWRKYKRKHMKSHTDTLTNTIIAVSHAMAWTSIVDTFTQISLTAWMLNDLVIGVVLNYFSNMVIVKPMNIWLCLERNQRWKMENEKWEREREIKTLAKSNRIEASPWRFM